MNACELCGYPIGDGNTSEAAGMELCTPCHSGRFGDRLAHRGLRLQCLVKQPHIEGSGGGQATREVAGAIAYDLELRASFSPEDWLAKVGKLFRRELQTGDPTFDPTVYVRTDHPDVLAQALRDERLRAAIVHAVQVTGTAIMLERGRVTLYWQSIPSEQVPATLRCVALVLHHLDRFAGACGLRPRPQPDSYPDLRDTIQFLESAKANVMSNLQPTGSRLLGGRSGGRAPARGQAQTSRQPPSQTKRAHDGWSIPRRTVTSRFATVGCTPLMRDPGVESHRIAPGSPNWM